MGFRGLGLGFGAQGLGLTVEGWGFGIQRGLGLRVWDLGLTVGM